MAKTKKPGVRFFSAEEKVYLDKFVAVPKRKKFPKELVQEFCTKFNRDVRSIYQYTNRFRNNKIVNVDKASAKTEKTSPVLTDFTAIKRNEFIIPVTNWELRTENGQTNLILKFK
jgi:hypothetical protein